MCADSFAEGWRYGHEFSKVSANNLISPEVSLSRDTEIELLLHSFGQSGGELQLYRTSALGHADTLIDTIVWSDSASSANLITCLPAGDYSVIFNAQGHAASASIGIHSISSEATPSSDCSYQPNTEEGCNMNELVIPFFLQTGLFS